MISSRTGAAELLGKLFKRISRQNMRHEPQIKTSLDVNGTGAGAQTSKDRW